MTVLSFTLEEASGVSSINPPVAQIFVEYQFLDFDSSELETPTSQPLPLPGQTAIFNFTKGIYCTVYCIVCYIDTCMYYYTCRVHY